MTKKNISLDDLISDGITSADLKRIFLKISSIIENRGYAEKLQAMFEFAVDNDPSLFTKIRVENNDSLEKMSADYISQWCKKYVDDRENPALKRPLKNYGEKDAALLERVAANTNQNKETLEKYIEGHFIYMSAENMNGAILEEYLAEVLEPHGWIWCAGSTFRAIDFCYLDKKNTILLQVKNKYNTENSSSSAIRLGTEIQKWNRLNRPRAVSGLDKPLPNWEKLIEIVQANENLTKLLTEEKYLDYIRENSTKELDILE